MKQQLEVKRLLAERNIAEGNYNQAANKLAEIIEYDLNNFPALISLGKCKLLHLASQPYLFYSNSDEITKSAVQYFYGAITCLKGEKDKVIKETLEEIFQIAISAINQFETNIFKERKSTEYYLKEAKSNWSASMQFGSKGISGSQPNASNFSRASWIKHEEFNTLFEKSQNRCKAYQLMLSQFKSVFKAFIEAASSYFDQHELNQLMFHFFDIDLKQEKIAEIKRQKEEEEYLREEQLILESLPQSFYDYKNEASNAYKLRHNKESLSAAPTAHDIYKQQLKEIDNSLKFKHSDKELDNIITTIKRKQKLRMQIVIGISIVVLILLITYLIKASNSY